MFRSGGEITGDKNGWLLFSAARPKSGCGLLRIEGEIIIPRRAERIENHRIVDRLGAMRDIARQIKRVTATHFMRDAGDDHVDVPLENMNDLFLRMLVFGHATAGFELGHHLIHRIPVGNGPPFYSRANFDPGISACHVRIIASDGSVRQSMPEFKPNAK